MCILCIDDAFQSYEETGEQFIDKRRQALLELDDQHIEEPAQFLQLVGITAMRHQQRDHRW